MNKIIYYESWQMDCCGDPFKIGDLIKWDVVDDNSTYPSDLNIVPDFGYEAHSFDGDGLKTIIGTVQKIFNVYYSYKDCPNRKVSYPSSTALLSVECSEVFLDDFNEKSHAAFIVYLTNVQIV